MTTVLYLACCAAAGILIGEGATRAMYRGEKPLVVVAASLAAAWVATIAISVAF